MSCPHDIKVSDGCINNSSPNQINYQFEFKMWLFILLDKSNWCKGPKLTQHQWKTGRKHTTLTR